MSKRRFVVLDRDGTIIEEKNYLSAPDQVQLLAGAARGLRHLQSLGLGLVIATNQSAVGRGYFDEARLAAIHARLREMLDAEAVAIDAIYFCPHVPDDRCLCRKPETGMIEQAARELSFDLAQTIVIGDKASDVEMGRRVGAETFLVRTGYGAEVAAQSRLVVDHVVEDLAEAAAVVGRSMGRGGERRNDH